MKAFFLVTGLLLSQIIFSQAVHERLTNAINALQDDTQCKHAAISLYVTDNKTGEIVFEKNPELGLAPASTQKIITSVSAFELLGSAYRYKTIMAYPGKINNGLVKSITLLEVVTPRLQAGDTME